MPVPAARRQAILGFPRIYPSTNPKIHDPSHPRSARPPKTLELDSILDVRTTLVGMKETLDKLSLAATPLCGIDSVVKIKKMWQ